MKKNLLTIITSVLLIGTINAQSNYDLVTSFSAEGYCLNDVLVQADGKILLSNYGGANVLRRLNADGTLDGTFAPALYGQFKKIFDHPSGIYALGYQIRRFDQTGTENCTNATLSFTSATGFINDAVQLSDGSIIGVGSFNDVWHSSGLTTLNCIVKHDVDLNLDAVFNTNVGDGFNGEVTCIELDSINDKLYIGGKFTEFDGHTVNGICRLNLDGTYDATFDGGTGFAVPGNYPKLIRMTQNGRFFVAGIFGTYNSNNASYALMLNNDGTYNSTFINTNGRKINDFIELGNETMIVVGEKNNMPGGLAVINSLTGSAAASSPVGNPPSGFGLSTTAISGSKLLTISKAADQKYVISGYFNEFSGEAFPIYPLVEIHLCDDPAQAEITFDNGMLSVSKIGDSYIWDAYDVNSNPIVLNDNTTSTQTPTVPGYYSVTVTNGVCTFSTDDFNLTSLGLSNSEKINFNLAPNPANSSVSMTNLEIGSTLLLTDMTGKIVFETIITSEEMSIDVNALNNGIYFVQMMNNSEISTSKKLVVSK